MPILIYIYSVYMSIMSMDIMTVVTFLLSYIYVSISPCLYYKGGISLQPTGLLTSEISDKNVVFLNYVDDIWFANQMQFCHILGFDVNSITEHYLQYLMSGWVIVPQTTPQYQTHRQTPSSNIN